MNKKFLALAALALITTGAQAKVKLPHILGDNMIIQQDSEANLWGWDKPGTTVKVSTSWSSRIYSTQTGKDGKWAVKVLTPKASYTPLSITFDDGEKTTINNVLAGEVWVCAGQSNMEMPVKGFGNCPVEGYNKVVLEANQYKGVHYVKIPSVMSSKPLDDANCEWKTINSETVGDASATGYFFAQVVNKALDVPVGLVMANKGGSRVESWLDRDYLKKNTKEDLDSLKMTKNPKFKWDFLYPLLWGNGTFHPILNYSVKGILFYQGCSNVGDPAGQYTQRLADLVAQWRRDFKQGELPFYFVQIAPSLKAGTVIVRAGVAIIHKEHRVREVVLFGVFQKDDLLVLNGQAFAEPCVLLRQSAVKCGDFIRCSRHCCVLLILWSNCQYRIGYRIKYSRIGRSCHSSAPSSSNFCWAFLADRKSVV